MTPHETTTRSADVPSAEERGRPVRIVSLGVPPTEPAGGDRPPPKAGQRPTLRVSGLLALVCLAVVLPATALATEALPPELEGVDLIERRGVAVSPELDFVDQDAQPVELGSYFDDDKPILLSLNYYECNSICSTQLEQLSETLDRVAVDGEAFRVVTVSIDPEEGPELADGFHDYYLGLLERDDIEWDFLVGSSESVRQLTETVGFHYHYDERTDQYAHLPVLVFLSPAGVVTQYLYMFPYAAGDVKLALMEASEGRIGNAFERLLSTCFHYADGEYAVWAMGVMRLGGAITVVVLGTMLLVMWRRERRQRRAEATT